MLVLKYSYTLYPFVLLAIGIFETERDKASISEQSSSIIQDWWVQIFKIHCHLFAVLEKQLYVKFSIASSSFVIPDIKRLQNEDSRKFYSLSQCQIIFLTLYFMVVEVNFFSV